MFQRLENSINRLDPVSAMTLKKALGQFRAGRMSHSLSLLTLAVQQAQQGQIITQQYFEILAEQSARAT